MKKAISLALALVLIAALTGAALGKLPWLWFWVLAGLIFAYTRLPKQK